jgi:hypothetical protein
MAHANVLYSPERYCSSLPLFHPVEEIHPGDVVWFSPAESHWHGAAATTAMTHIAIQEKLDGKVVICLTILACCCGDLNATREHRSAA